MARPRKDIQQVLLERARDLQALIEHFCVTRPLQCEGYKSADQFNIQSFFAQQKLVFSWNRQSGKNKRTYYWQYNTCRKRLNEVMGIPHQLICEVLGRFNNKRIQLEDVWRIIDTPSTWRIVNGGAKSKWNGKTKKVLWSWSRKIIPISRKLWISMLQNNDYGSVDTAPNMTERTRKLVKEYESIPALAEKFVSINAPDEAVYKAMQKWNHPSWTIEMVLKRMKTIRRVEEKNQKKC